MGPLFPGCAHVAPPRATACRCENLAQCASDCAGELVDLLDRHGDFAAVIAEPIRCTTVRVPPPGYWRSVRAACDRTGTLLIFDEIPTALGRTGELFACDTATVGVAPDLLVLGKGLGGGVVPMAALLAHERLNVAGHKAIGHYTHEKSPVGCAAALATLDVIDDEGLLERSRSLGQHALARLWAMADRHACVADVRGVGLLIGVELRSAGSAPRAAALAERVMYAALTRGLSFKVSGGNVLTLTPPLIITREQLDWALDVLDQSIGVAVDGRDERL
jgi:4-aminobutyrate aminotransferase